MVGLDSAQLCEEGRWITEYSREMNVYDAGSDAGPSFLSPDEPEATRMPISR